jgi:hypothetical protein
MRRVVLALCCLVGAWLAPATAQEWYRLTSAEGAFTASLPARPEYEAVPIRQGEYTLHQWVFDVADTAYLVSYIDYNRGHVANSGGLQVILNSLTAGLHKTRTPVSERHITYGGHAARDVVVHDPSGFTIRQRHMMVGDRAYVWNYTGTVGTETAPDLQRFLDSLVIRR